MLPKQTNAAVLFDTNRQLEICTIDLPELERGQVLVEVSYSGVCRSQLMEVTGQRGEDKWLPHLLGHEGCGKVLSVGEDVTKVAAGDLVILGWIKGDGIDAAPAQYRYNDQIINSGCVTTFSNHTVVSENRLIRLPEGLPMDVGVLFGCALPTGAGIVFNEIKPTIDDVVAIVGLGGIGLSALMACVNIGVETIIAIDLSKDKLELARKFGATHTVNSKHENVDQWVQAHQPQGIDFCVEAAGHVSTIEMGFRLIKTGGGLLVFASHPPEGDNITLPPHDLIRGKKIQGSWGGACFPDNDVPKLSRSYLDGKLPLDDLITSHYRLEQINMALADLAAGKVFRPLIVMEHA